MKKKAPMFLGIASVAVFSTYLARADNIDPTNLEHISARYSCRENYEGHPYDAIVIARTDMDSVFELRACRCPDTCSDIDIYQITPEPLHNPFKP